jgi:7-cyano-7-deazaguanine synthase
VSILLISGGLDSAVATAWALQHTASPHIPISFFYGQRHAIERDYASRLCDHFGLAQPRNINLAQAFATIGGSSLTSGLVHGNPSLEEVERTESDLPPSFVPGRNMIMLSVAAAIGYVEKTYEIVGGWNVLDYSGYPDCRPNFLTAVERAATLALDHDIVVTAPLLHLTKAEIISMGLKLDVPFSLTYSCYAGAEQPCGECDSCVIRTGGFTANGIADPALTV